MKFALALIGLCLLLSACGTTALTDITVPGKGRIMAGMTGDEVRAVMGSKPDRVGSGRTGCHYTSHFRYAPGTGTTEWAWNQPGEVFVVYLENGIVANVGYAQPLMASAREIIDPMATPRELIEQYYDGWIRSDRELVRSLLADRVKFRSPDDEFDDADSFLTECWKFAEGFDRMDVVHSVFGDDAGYLVYTFGDFAIGELVKVRDGRIAEIYVTYNATK